MHPKPLAAIRHAGLVPASTVRLDQPISGRADGWTPEQVRGDGSAAGPSAQLRILPPLLIALALAACGPTAPPASTPPPPVRDSAPALGLDRVLGQTAPTVTGLFGPPALDIREGQGRKLQYRSPACVLDAYLYPQPGGGDPKVSWIDTRTPAGADFDRASCIASLARSDALKPARTAPAAARPGRRKR